MRGGDLKLFLRSHGFSCYAASVAPAGSAWDRAGELYAQFTGTRVDYGEAHSRMYGHARFGRDFRDAPLIPDWNARTRLVLLGHSFGGATVRMFSELLAHGDAAEQAATPAETRSPLFTGGMEDRLHSLVTLASPMNGTTAYDLFEDPAFDAGTVHVPWWSRALARMMSMGTRLKPDGRDARDYARYDMHVDRAMAFNGRMQPLSHVYYFSVPCSYTTRLKDGTYRPRRGMEPLFVMRACQIGAYSGISRGGLVLNEVWRENDGPVNTYSARAPLDAPSVPLDCTHMKPGVWNVFPDYDGDHMALQGGLMHRHDIRAFYLELCTMMLSYRIRYRPMKE